MKLPTLLDSWEDAPTEADWDRAPIESLATVVQELAERFDVEAAIANRTERKSDAQTEQFLLCRELLEGCVKPLVNKVAALGLNNATLKFVRLLEHVPGALLLDLWEGKTEVSFPYELFDVEPFIAVCAPEPESPKALDWVAKALLLKKANPELSDREIARRVGVVHTTLIRNSMYRDFREMLKGELPGGARSTDGDVEAWER